jgi:hypothetical protein
MEPFIIRMWLISYLYSIVWGIAALASNLREPPQEVEEMRKATPTP